MTLFISYTDEQVIDFIREGSEEAYAELFDRHWENVYNMIYSRIRQREATEEMAQDIFMKLWDKRAELSIRNFSAYLYTCVRHRCLNYIESKIVHKKHWQYYKEFLPAQDNSTDVTIAFNDLRDALEKGLAAIPEKSQTIFRLNRLEGKSVKEIAARMKLTEKAIQYHLNRSTKYLRTYLKEFFLFLALFLLD